MAKRVSSKTRRRSSVTRKVKASGCSQTIVWAQITSTKGLSQVWVPNIMYSKIATPIVRRTKGSFAKKMLRARMAPLGIKAITCTGKCSGTCSIQNKVDPQGNVRTTCDCI